jgi:signal transduction histidine kinase
MRRTLAPVAAIAAFRAVALGTYQALRAGAGESVATEVLGWIYVASLPLVTLAFAAGLLTQRLFVADALERLTGGLKQHVNAAALRSALATALEDPSLGVVYWIQGEPGRWVDESGWPIQAPQAAPGRSVTEVTADGRRIAAITHDDALESSLVAAASSYALGALENERLVGELHASLEELAGSRARIAAEANRERRKIERDLHDGAQQRLVALKVKLELAAERVEESSPESAHALRALEHDVDGTIDEVRSFARGIYPPLLTERGLTEALRAAGRSAPLTTVIHAVSIGRFRPEVEAAVYFACMEALQNAAKHAQGASGVVITVTNNPRLRFEVSDDGAGFDTAHTASGTGLTNLRDRLLAVGGELTVESTPGVGTRISGVIPVS